VQRALVSEWSGAVAELQQFPAQEPVTIEQVELTAADFADAGAIRYWGHDVEDKAWYDSIDGWVRTYRRSLALLDPDVVTLDQSASGSALVQSIRSEHPDYRVVEFHQRGRGDLSSFNWSSVVMAFELRNGGWELTLLTHQTWTP
jgi:hypothetical protein